MSSPKPYWKKCIQSATRPMCGCLMIFKHNFHIDIRRVEQSIFVSYAAMTSLARSTCYFDLFGYGCFCSSTWWAQCWSCWCMLMHADACCWCVVPLLRFYWLIAKHCSADFPQAAFKEGIARLDESSKDLEASLSGLRRCSVATSTAGDWNRA